MSNRLVDMNPRERRLLGATIAVLLVAAGFLGVRGALANLRSLNSKIDQLELEIVNLEQQHVQRSAVDAAYHAVVTEHSSALTVAEIHDHLRREIYDLAQVNIPATGDKPATTMQLVSIPALEMGELKEGDDHREYRIQFDIPVARLDLLVAFLQRVESSDQLLRIDRLDVGRTPGTQSVNASIEITRTVLDNPEAIDQGAAG